MTLTDDGPVVPNRKIHQSMKCAYHSFARRCESDLMCDDGLHRLILSSSLIMSDAYTSVRIELPRDLDLLTRFYNELMKPNFPVENELEVGWYNLHLLM